MPGLNPKKKLLVCFFKQDSGREPVKEWLHSITSQERKIVGESIKLVQEGWPLGMPLVKNLGKGLWEIRINLPFSIARIIFVMHESQIVLLHSFMKKTQKTPQQDLDIALIRAKEIKKG